MVDQKDLDKILTEGWDWHPQVIKQLKARGVPDDVIRAASVVSARHGFKGEDEELFLKYVHQKGDCATEASIMVAAEQVAARHERRIEAMANREGNYQTIDKMLEADVSPRVVDYAISVAARTRLSVKGRDVLFKRLAFIGSRATQDSVDAEVRTLERYTDDDLDMLPPPEAISDLAVKAKDLLKRMSEYGESRKNGGPEDPQIEWVVANAPALLTAFGSMLLGGLARHEEAKGGEDVDE